MADAVDKNQVSQAFKATMHALGRELPAQLRVMRRSGKSLVAITAPNRRK